MFHHFSSFFISFFVFFIFFIFFIFFFFFRSSEQTPKPAKNRPEVLFVKGRFISFSENSIFGPRWTGGVWSGPFEGDFAFMFLLFLFPILSGIHTKTDLRGAQLRARRCGRIRCVSGQSMTVHKGRPVKKGPAACVGLLGSATPWL